MSYIDKNSNVVISARITNKGRQLLSKGLLTFDTFRLGDSEIDYSTFSNLNIDDEIAKAVVWHVGSKFAVKWLTKKIPVLDYQKPIDVMELQEGNVILRSALMRMP